MNKISKKIKEKIIKNIYLFIPIKNVTAYSGFFLNKALNYRVMKNRFHRNYGYPLNLKNPKTINEKIFWKKIHDRNPLLPLTADKYLVREYVKKTLGEETAQEILIPLLFVTDNPKTIPFEKLSLPFIIKPNHASGKYIIVRDKNYNKREIIKTCWSWLKTPYGLEKLEWAYQSIKRKIVIEKLLLDEHGEIPIDFKFSMFHGSCKLIKVFFNRMTMRLTSSFDSNWTYLPEKRTDRPPGPIIKKPKNFEIMLKYAEKLSCPFDYVRVDLYNINGKIYFGELTHYPKSGNLRADSISNILELGKYWNIKPNYWKIKNVN